MTTPPTLDVVFEATHNPKIHTLTLVRLVDGEPRPLLDPINNFTIDRGGWSDDWHVERVGPGEQDHAANLESAKQLLNASHVDPPYIFRSGLFWGRKGGALSREAVIASLSDAGLRVATTNECLPTPMARYEFGPLVQELFDVTGCRAIVFAGHTITVHDVDVDAVEVAKIALTKGTFPAGVNIGFVVAEPV